MSKQQPNRWLHVGIVFLIILSAGLIFMGLGMPRPLVPAFVVVPVVAYNWLRGSCRFLDSLSFVALVLGFGFWYWHQQTTPEGQAAPWWALVLFLLPGVLLHGLSQWVQRAGTKRSTPLCE